MTQSLFELDPDVAGAHESRAFQSMFAPGRLTFGVFFPIEAFSGDRPTMVDQVSLARRAEELGFAALWFRDVPLRDPSFGDVGQIFDPWVYLGFIAAQTQRIALATGSIVLPLRHPLHTAKAAASVDQLSGGRLLLGIASGDRPVEFPAFGVDVEQRGELFRENVRVIRHAFERSFEPVSSPYGTLAGTDLVPKPVRRIPLLVTGSSRQSLEWIAQSSDGWITYPRPALQQARLAHQWHEMVQTELPRHVQAVRAVVLRRPRGGSRRAPHPDPSGLSWWLEGAPGVCARLACRRSEPRGLQPQIRPAQRAGRARGDRPRGVAPHRMIVRHRDRIHAPDRAREGSLIFKSQ